MGLAEWFDTFCSNIQVRDGSTIASMSKLITKSLNVDFWTNTSETYGRSTAIQGFSDLDMVFELPSDIYWQYDRYQGNGQSALLQAVGFL